MSDQIIHITDASFEQDVLESELPVLVDFWAEWCGPCKAIAPALAEIAEEFGDSVRIAKLNIDENAKTPPTYGVRSIPTLMLFNGGTVQGHKIGAVSKAQISEFLTENLAKS